MFEYMKLRRHGVLNFQPKVEIYHDRGQFIMKTVTDSEELIEALRLRYQIFHREMIGKSKPTGIDVDDFDFSCDHLIIKDKKTNRIVGTYRMNCSKFSDRFYSAQEFHLKKILDRPGTKLELGRACIDKEFRKGIVISLLWRGIAEYMCKTNSDVLFGCATIMTQSPRQAALIYSYFEQEGRFQQNSLCPPTLKYSMPGIENWIHSMQRELTLDEKTEVEALIPGLCRAYLKAGASLGGEPAWDEEFQCIDFLTILERENLNKALWRKYDLCPPSEKKPETKHSSSSRVETNLRAIS